MSLSVFISLARPPREFVKINFDGYKSHSSTTGSLINRSWDGRFLRVGTFNLGAVSFLVAKATTMRNRVCATVQTRYCLVVLKGDNQVLI